MSAPRPRAYRVMLLEWLSHSVIIEASSEALAIYKARQLWDSGDTASFSFREGGLDHVFAEEV